MIAVNRPTWLLLGAILLAGHGVGLIGCDANSSSRSGPPVTSLGQAPQQDFPTTSAGSLNDDAIGRTLAVDGEIVKQCPAAGCWFIVKDATGEVFVDLNPAKVHLERTRTGQRAHVTGRVVKQGGQYRLEAQHVRFATKTDPASKNPQ